MGSINGTSRFCIAVALFSMLMVTPMVRAQAQRQPEPSTPNAIEMNTQAPSDTKNIVRDANSGADPSSSAARPSESGDPHAQFKNSASLKWMARKLGVRTATAYELSVVVNFLAIIAAGFLLLRSRLPALFRNRTQVIRQALDEAQKTSAEAQQRLSAIEGRLAKLQSEISALQSTADQESSAEEIRIRAAAEEEKRKIVQGAEQEIAVAVSLAKRDFKVYAANLAVTLAANSIEVDASTDEALLRAFVEQLGRNGSN